MSKQFKCQCGESSKDTMLIIKPNVFMHNEKWFAMYREPNELICLSCLEEELQQLKERY